MIDNYSLSVIQPMPSSRGRSSGKVSRSLSSCCIHTARAYRPQRYGRCDRAMWMQHHDHSIAICVRVHLQLQCVFRSNRSNVGLRFTRHYTNTSLVAPSACFTANLTNFHVHYNIHLLSYLHFYLLTLCHAHCRLRFVVIWKSWAVIVYVLNV